MTNPIRVQVQDGKFEKERALMYLLDAIVYLDSSIRHYTPVDREFLIQLKTLLEEVKDGYTEGKNKSCT